MLRRLSALDEMRREASPELGLRIARPRDHVIASAYLCLRQCLLAMQPILHQDVHHDVITLGIVKLVALHWRLVRGRVGARVSSGIAICHDAVRVVLQPPFERES